jgi:hypothetical protein
LNSPTIHLHPFTYLLLLCAVVAERTAKAELEAAARSADKLALELFRVLTAADAAALAALTAVEAAERKWAEEQAARTRLVTTYVSYVLLERARALEHEKGKLTLRSVELTHFAQRQFEAERIVSDLAAVAAAVAVAAEEECRRHETAASVSDQRARSLAMEVRGAREPDRRY